MLKLDLQMFAEGDGGAVETPVEKPSFADMYNNGPQVEEPDNDTDPGTDDDIVNNDSGEVAGGDTDPADDDNQQSQIQQQQPWKNQQNAEFAAQRRRQEEAQRQQAAVDAAYARIYAGQANPYTGKPILTEADYNAYVQQHTMEQLKQADVDPNMFQQAVNADPRVRQANAVLQQQQVMQAMMAQQQQAQQFNASLDAIKKFDKDVKTFEDIIKNPHFAEIEEKYKKGYSLEDAYYLANKTELEQKKQAATRQQVINQATSKQHMKATGQQGVGDEIVVPADVMAAYRRMNPKATESEIKKHYAKCVSKQ